MITNMTSFIDQILIWVDSYLAVSSIKQGPIVALQRDTMPHVAD